MRRERGQSRRRQRRIRGSRTGLVEERARTSGWRLGHEITDRQVGRLRAINQQSEPVADRPEVACLLLDTEDTVLGQS